MGKNLSKRSGSFSSRSPVQNVSEEVTQDSSRTLLSVTAPNPSAITTSQQHDFVKPFTEGGADGLQPSVDQEPTTSISTPDSIEAQPAAANYDTEAKTANENYQYCVIDIENSGEGVIVYLKSKW